MFEQVRIAAKAAMESQDALLHAFREYEGIGMDHRLTDDDYCILRHLVWAKIYPVSAFSVLVKHNQDIAIEVLLSRYVGHGVDPDSGFGGLTFDLSSMLSDLVEVGGERLLKSFLHHPRFNKHFLDDPRFRESLGFALDTDLEGVQEWLSMKTE